jgi:hypothetical protein
MSLLTDTLNALDRTERYRRPCAAYLGQLRRYPGDLAPLGETALVGMAIAMYECPPSPGWIPEVQRRAMEYMSVAERVQAASS